MIAQLSGEVISTGDRWVVIDIGGVGYQVQVTGPALETLRQAQGRVTVHTHMAVRDDDIRLFGFLHQRERELFTILIGVSGIGPQIAMNILSGIAFEDFAVAILDGDEKTLTRIPGIGKKGAGRLILELKEKMKKHADTIAAGRRPTRANDAASALISLGFSPQEAGEAVDAVLPGLSDASVQDLIRAALAHLRERRS